MKVQNIITRVCPIWRPSWGDLGTTWSTRTSCSPRGSRPGLGSMLLVSCREQDGELQQIEWVSYNLISRIQVTTELQSKLKYLCEIKQGNDQAFPLHYKLVIFKSINHIFICLSHTLHLLLSSCGDSALGHSYLQSWGGRQRERRGGGPRGGEDCRQPSSGSGSSLSQLHRICSLWQGRGRMQGKWSFHPRLFSSDRGSAKFFTDFGTVTVVIGLH